MCSEATRAERSERSSEGEEALANWVAYDSQVAMSISPWGSTSFTPLSCGSWRGYCEEEFEWDLERGIGPSLGCGLR